MVATGMLPDVTDVATDGQIQVTESNYNGSYYPSNIRGFFDPTKTSEGKVRLFIPLLECETADFCQ